MPNININGFINLGNTCYLNSALQLLFSIEEIKNYFVNKGFLEELNNNLKKVNFKNNNNIKNNILFIQNFFSLIRDYASNDNKTLSPNNLLNSIRNINKDFVGFYQHDSQEILLIIMDVIHENLKYEVDVNYQGQPKNDTDVLVIESIEALKKILNYKYSIVNELFYGMYYCQYVSVENSNKGMLVSKNYEHFNNLTLEFDGNHLIDNLDIFFKDELLDSELLHEKTKKKYKVKKIVKIINAPKYLFVTLKKYNQQHKTHNNSYTFPIYNLDFSKYCMGYDSYKCNYDLIGAICHRGNLDYGHYYSILNKNNNWFVVNDESISKFNIEKNKQKLFNDAYVLLYTKNNN